MISEIVLSTLFLIIINIVWFIMIKKLKQVKIQLRESNELNITLKQRVDESIKKINELNNNESEFLKIIDLMSDRFEELKEYSFDIYEASNEMYMFLLSKLNKGFLEDNEDVRELASKLKEFIIGSQNIQDNYKNLFLEEVDENDEDRKQLVDDIGIDTDELLDDIDTDEEYYNDEEEIEYFDGDDYDDDLIK